jgi:hypothetical protein
MPIARVKAALIPDKYASRTIGSCSAVKTSRSCVAPVAMRSSGLMLEAVLMTVFRNAACAAAREKAPPIILKTV